MGRLPNMKERVRSIYARSVALLSEIDSLEGRLLFVLGELWNRRSVKGTMSKTNATRILLSGNERRIVTGTDDEIGLAAERMRRRTRKCVTVAVIVGHYHVGACESRPTSGGYDPEGN